MNKNITILLTCLLININFIYSAAVIKTESDPIKEGKAYQLIMEIYKADVDSIKKLLDENADVNYPSRKYEKPMYPLSEAINNINAIIYESSPDFGRDQMLNPYGLEIVQLLLDKGANPNLTEYYGIPLLIHLVDKGGLDTINLYKLFKMLIDAGADVNAVDSKGNSILIHLIQQLLEGTQDLSYPTTKKKVKQAENIIKLLIKSGINLDHKNKAGQKAMDLIPAFKLKMEAAAPSYIYDYFLYQPPTSISIQSEKLEDDFNYIQELVSRKGKIIEELTGTLPKEVAKIIGEYDVIELPTTEEIENFDPKMKASDKLYWN